MSDKTARVEAAKAKLKAAAAAREAAYKAFSALAQEAEEVEMEVLFAGKDDWEDLSEAEQAAVMAHCAAATPGSWTHDYATRGFGASATDWKVRHHLTMMRDSLRIEEADRRLKEWKKAKGKARKAAKAAE